MAKEKTAAEVKTATVTPENIMDQIRNENLMSQAITKHAEEAIEKEKNERMATQLKEAMYKSDYMNRLAVLQVRNDRKKSRITLEKVEKSEILKDQLTGFVLTEEKIKKHGGKDGKLEVEIVADYESGKKQKQTYSLKKGEEVWVPGSLTMREYDRKLDELTREIDKKYRDASIEHDNNVSELKERYPGYWRYDWRW